MHCGGLRLLLLVEYERVTSSIDGAVRARGGTCSRRLSSC